MATHRRSAKFDAVLVHLDEPQVVTLMSQKIRIIAMAIPDSDLDKSIFFATTVSAKDWDRYLNGIVDLRYLFTFAKQRLQYTFDLNDLDDNGKVMMTPFEDDVDEKNLVLPRFFSSNHTHIFAAADKASDTEKLIIDGEWELTDFGQFQQKFSDIYAFVISSDRWTDANTPIESKKRIKGAFLNRPFQGGFSYVHLFKDLSANVPRSDQLNLNRIQYASPGQVEVFGKEDVFERMHHIIPNFLQNRENIRDMYRKFYQYLSENFYLKLSGDQYLAGDPTEEFMKSRSKSLSEAMLAPDFDAIWEITGHNALVTSKVVLSFYRRLSDAATYFAQGRVSYPD